MRVYEEGAGGCLGERHWMDTHLDFLHVLDCLYVRRCAGGVGFFDVTVIVHNMSNIDEHECGLNDSACISVREEHCYMHFLQRQTFLACISVVDEPGYIQLAVAVNVLSGEENQTQLHLVASPQVLRHPYFSVSFNQVVLRAFPFHDLQVSCDDVMPSLIIVARVRPEGSNILIHHHHSRSLTLRKLVIVETIAPNPDLLQLGQSPALLFWRRFQQCPRHRVRNRMIDGKAVKPRR